MTEPIEPAEREAAPDAVPLAAEELTDDDLKGADVHPQTPGDAEPEEA